MGKYETGRYESNSDFWKDIRGYHYETDVFIKPKWCERRL
jgi:hypothetical protein